MTEYHVGCGLAGIYAGVLKSNKKDEWKDKTECTDEAIAAVRDYMVDNCLGGLRNPERNHGGYKWTLKDGRTVRLTIEIDNEVPHGNK